VIKHGSLEKELYRAQCLLNSAWLESNKLERCHLLDWTSAESTPGNHFRSRPIEKKLSKVWSILNPKMVKDEARL